MTFEYLPHTADRKIIARGNDLAEAFGEGALAVYNTITDITKMGSMEEGDFDIEAESKEALLYDFIDELLFALDTKGFIGCQVKDIKIVEKDGKFRLTAVFLGDDYRNCEHHGDVKAMTYNDMEINEKGGKTEIIFVVDV